MVRAHVKHPAEETKASTGKKRGPSKVAVKAQQQGQQQLSGAWLCKINDCNKRFVREADLKRHQRTSKEHMNSKPILCPQCDSTFTRADALRRHQKSRHNGVIIDPEDTNNGKDETVEDEDTSGPQSRAHTPSRSKDRKRKSSPIASASNSIPVQTVLTTPSAPGPSTGSQSYYRHNTVNAVFVPPRTPNGTLDTSSAYQPQLPMSTARFHAWTPSNRTVADKSDATRAAPALTPYIPTQSSGYYPPGAYYRSADGQPVLPLQMANGTATVQTNLQPDGNISTDGTSTTPPPLKPLAEYDSNIDPSLQTGATVSVASENDAEQNPADGRKQTEEALAETGLSPAVQKAIQAVLAIDSKNVARSHVSVPQGDSEKSKVGEPLSDTPEEQSLQLVSPDQQNGHADASAENTMDLDADGEADAEGDVLLKMNRPQDVSPQIETESSSLPDGIKELINEDSLSFAPPIIH